MKKLVVVIVVVLAVFVIWNTVKAPKGGVPSQQVQNTEPIKIGVVGPLTGDISSLGVPAAKAVELAVNEVNSKGGINGRKVELIIEDGSCTTKKATDAGSKLINIDKVVAIVGGFCSGESSAFGPVAMQNKIIMISPVSSAPSLSHLGKFFFRDYPSDEFQGKYAAEYLYNKLGAKKVAVVYTNSDWGTGVRNVFEREYKALGGEIVLSEGATQDTRDFRTVVGKVKSSKADYLYLPLFPEGSITLMKQMKEAKVSMKIFGADAWADTQFQSSFDPSFDAIYVEVATGSSDEFTNKFMAAYPDLKIGVGTAQAYDAANIILNAIKQIGTDNPDALADAIRSVKYDGISGHIEFDQNGDMTQANYVVKKLLGKGKVEEVK
jgi:branched-chain amino acid transport system substrate-binding protein